MYILFLMKTTQSTVGAVVVSTACVGRGVYETAIIVGGNVSDPISVSSGKAAAMVAHDATCDCVRGYVRDGIRAERVARFLKEVA